MQLKKLIEKIETFAPPGLALDWDRCGIQVAGTRQEIKRMALALDPDEQTIQKTIDLQAEFLLTHHPLSIKPRLPDTPDSFHRIIKSLLTTDTILYSAHTSLDVNPLGPAAWLSRKLGLKDTSVLDPVFISEASEISFHQPLPLSPEELPLQEHILNFKTNDQGLVTDVTLFQDTVDTFIAGLKDIVWPFSFVSIHCPGFQVEFGLGFSGTLPAPVSFDDFSRNLKNILGIEKIIQAGDSPDMVSIVSCCPGSGGDLAMKAFNAGADVFITGDLKYHQAREASGLGCVFDVGHFILEEKMMFQWSLTLKDQLEDIEIYFIEGCSPFKIF